MTRYAGQFGRQRAFTDFLGGYGDVTWGTGQVVLEGGWAMCSVNEGTINEVTDESGGVLQFLTDTGDDDNVALFTGKFQPSQGGCVLEARFKVADDMGVGIFAGFTETLVMATPVVPAEFATATMTYNGTGGMIGAQYDDDGTTDDWRAVLADGGANTGGTASANGVRANATVTADDWQLVRVELDADGAGRVIVNGKVVKEYETAGVTATDLFYACLIVENRTAAAREVEVDYLYAEGSRDWDDQ